MGRGSRISKVCQTRNRLFEVEMYIRDITLAGRTYERTASPSVKELQLHPISTFHREFFLHFRSF